MEILRVTNYTILPTHTTLTPTLFTTNLSFFIQQGGTL